MNNAQTAVDKLNIRPFAKECQAAFELPQLRSFVNAVVVAENNAVHAVQHYFDTLQIRTHIFRDKNDK